MKTARTNIRVRYDEVDKMGFVYHGNYAKYYHLGRTQLLRSFGVFDKELEDDGIIMPVVELNIQYLKPVFYDNLICVKTTLVETSGVKLNFIHTVFNQNDEIINRARSTLVFVDAKTRKPMRIPNEISNKLK